MKIQPWALPLIVLENLDFKLLLFVRRVNLLLFDNYGNLISNRQSDEVWIAKELQQPDVFRLFFRLGELLMLFELPSLLMRIHLTCTVHLTLFVAVLVTYLVDD
jgi:hypothetical protein